MIFEEAVRREKFQNISISSILVQNPLKIEHRFVRQTVLRIANILALYCSGSKLYTHFAQNF